MSDAKKTKSAPSYSQEQLFGVVLSPVITEKATRGSEHNQVTFRVRQARFDDQYALKDQSIIVKMDVEGYEFKALEGMERTLRDNACYLQVEHYGTELERLRDASRR